MVVGVDTEWSQGRTLTIQCAGQHGRVVRARVYRDLSIPDLPAGFNLADAVMPAGSPYRALCDGLDVRSAGPITPELSPAVMARDLLDLPAAVPLSRAEFLRRTAGLGRDSGPPFANAEWNPRDRTWRVPTVRLTVVCHFQRADLGRMFGAGFFADLGAAANVRLTGHHSHRRGGRCAPHRRRPPAPAVVLRGHKLLQFRPRVVEYLLVGQDAYALHLTLRDTSLLFGPGSLDHLSRTFIGVGKAGGLTPADKAEMARVFHERTAEASTYAVTDAVTTLLVYERMREMDRRVYQLLGLPDRPGRVIRGTLGGRVSGLVVEDALERANAETPQGVEPLTRRELEDLMAQGGKEFHRPPYAGKFGHQALGVHGGLLYTRSPARLWYESDGQLGDVDLEAFYSRLLAQMHVYWGRPVVLEPGRHAMTLGQAVALARKHADPDAWVIRASGPIAGVPNVLVPSTDDALTAAGYRVKLGRGCNRADAARRAAHAERLADPAASARGGARLYAGVVEFGVVTDSTWRVIRMLPPDFRTQYEGLRVDSLTLYPRKLVAGSLAEYRALRERYRDGGAPWGQRLDLRGMRLVEERVIDHEYVSLRYPVGELATVAREQRAAARAEKNEGLALAWKATANSIFGVLGSPHHPTRNVVAANQVSARGRALAFVLGQSLNAIQTITDGCTYRRDQVPAGTLTDCLTVNPCYPAERAEDGPDVRFLDPDGIPTDDSEFNRWLICHIARFFGVPVRQVRELFGDHRVAHKPAGEGRGPWFDGLAVDGSGNHIKCVRRADGGWEPGEVALRGHGRGARGVLVPYLVATYSADRLTDLPPVGEDRDLLGPKPAAAAVRRAIGGGACRARYPLGFARAKVVSYRVIKMSAFLFQTPAQRRKVLRQVQRFEDRHGCGLELLALRRGYRGRREGSLADLAEAVREMIASGGDRLDTTLNIRKLDERLVTMTADRKKAIEARRAENDAAFERAVLLDPFDPPVTGPVVERDHPGVITL
jgi:hypothetical protein